MTIVNSDIWMGMSCRCQTALVWLLVACEILKEEVKYLLAYAAVQIVIPINQIFSPGRHFHFLIVLFLFCSQ